MEVIPVKASPQAVIVSAVRTPMGSFNGVFSSIPATKLGSVAISEALKRIALSGELVNEVYMGCVLAAGLGQAPAPRAAWRAGAWPLRWERPPLTKSAPQVSWL